MICASVIHIKSRRVGAALWFADVPQQLLHLARADVDGLPDGRHCLRAVQPGSDLAVRAKEPR